MRAPFTDRAGLLTVLATEDHEWLADEPAEDRERADRFLDVGIAYMRSATARPAHFDVMFQPGLYHFDDPRVCAARDRASEMVHSGAATLPRPSEAGTYDLGIAAWSLVHGVTTLWLAGALPANGRTLCRSDEPRRRIATTSPRSPRGAPDDCRTGSARRMDQAAAVAVSSPP